MRHPNKVVIITGAAQGIGESIARKLCASGYMSAILDVNGSKAEALAEELTISGAAVEAFCADVSNVKRVRETVQEIYGKYGRIDALVNNAGILHSTPIEDITEDEWDRIMAVNLKSVFFMSQAVIPHMKEAGGGRIVNMSSLAGRMGGIANGVGYSASKAGILGLTKALASRLAPFRINVNAIAPGTTATELITQFTPEKIDALCASIPLGRLGKAEEIAELADFLLSGAAGFITGAVFDINGGQYIA